MPVEIKKSGHEVSDKTSSSLITSIEKNSFSIREKLLSERPLIQGPRFKNKAITELEKLAHTLLSNEGESVYYSVNECDELLAYTKESVFNITHLLRYEPDFEHVQFSEYQLNYYEESFLDRLSKHILNNKQKIFIEDINKDNNILSNSDMFYINIKKSKDDYNKFQDKYPKLANEKSLSFAEFFAIQFYTSTSENSAEIQGFLRDEKKWLRNKKNLIINDPFFISQLLLSVMMIGYAFSIHYNSNWVKINHNVLCREERRDFNDHHFKNYLGDGENPTLISVKGFFSTTYDEKYIFEEEFNVYIEIRLPENPINSLGKKIESMSVYPKEHEVLFLPHTQFLFEKNKNPNNDEGKFYFYATPVRSIEGIKDYSDANQIRDILLKFGDNNFIHSYAKKLKELDEKSYKKDNVYDKDAYIKDFKALKDEIESFLKKSIKRSLNEIKESENINKNLISIINSFSCLWVKNNYPSILRRNIEYIYNEHLCQPYKNKGCIDRSNYGLAHTLRVIHYVPDVIKYFKEFAKEENFKVFCKNITEEEKLKIQTAMLFSVSGRESNGEFIGDNDNQYRENTANQFLKFSERFKLDKSTKETYKELICKLGDLSFINECFDNKKLYLFHIMNLSHKLDLQRCYSENEYTKSMNTIKYLVIQSNKQKFALNSLMEKVTDNIQTTGDQLCCQYDKKKQTTIDQKKHYEPFFAPVSTNPDICLYLLESQKTIPKHKTNMCLFC